MKVHGINRLGIAATAAVLAHVGVGLALSLMLPVTVPEVDVEVSPPLEIPRRFEVNVMAVADAPQLSELAAKETEDSVVESPSIPLSKVELTEPATEVKGTEDSKERSEEIVQIEKRSVPEQVQTMVAEPREKTARTRESQPAASPPRLAPPSRKEVKKKSVKPQLAAPHVATGPTRGPVQVSSPQPRYPRSLERKGIGGTVAIALRIDASGRVAQASVARGSGQRELDRAALAAVKRWRFKPALKNGHKTDFQTRVNIVFKPRR